MSIAAEIEAALRARLPSALHAHISGLALALAEVADGMIWGAEPQAHTIAEPVFAPLCESLAGQTFTAGMLSYRFGLSGQVGTVTVCGPVGDRGDRTALVSGERGVAVSGGVKDSTLLTGDIHHHHYPTRAPIGIPFQAPPLPTHFVPRPEVSRDLKARLSSVGASPGALVIAALHGLGGIGKSTLAADLAHDGELRARFFPDGVFWATLGQQPDLLPLLSGWVQALGDFTFKPLSVDAATAHLRTLLQEKAALLVVDDAWDPTRVTPFLVGGPRCRVLITTRDATIARAVGAALYDLDVMTPKQALALFEGRLGRDLGGEERDRARAVAEAVGYLPLALELAAALVADAIPWGALLADLKAEVARLDSLEIPGSEEMSDEATRKRLSLLSSFHLTLRRLPDPKCRDFAWLGVLPEDVALTPAMAATLWDTDMRSARTTLRYLRDKALLLTGVPQPDGAPTYALHDLVHDTARRLLTAPSNPDRPDDVPGLGLTLLDAHALLLKRYRTRTLGSIWHTLPDDGYIHAHLTWHLERAGREDELHGLLREETPAGRNGWFEVRERLGQVAGYLADLARARGAVVRRAGPRPHALGLRCRYALIATSLNSLAGNLPPELLAALVERGGWLPAQGLAYACQVPDPGQRVRALGALAPHLTESLLAAALEAVRSLGNEGRRAEALWRWRRTCRRRCSPRRWRRRGRSGTSGGGPRRWGRWRRS